MSIQTLVLCPGLHQRSLEKRYPDLWKTPWSCAVYLGSVRSSVTSTRPLSCCPSKNLRALNFTLLAFQLGPFPM